VSNTEAYTKVGGLSNDDLDFIRMTLTLISGGGCLVGALIVLLYPIPEYRGTSKLNSNSSTIIEEEQI
jgi:hypothetical protein